MNAFPVRTSMCGAPLRPANAYVGQTTDTRPTSLLGSAISVSRLKSSFMQRKRSKPHSFGEQLEAEKVRLKLQAGKLPNGPLKDAVNLKIRQVEAATRMNEWLSSPGLKPTTQSGGR